MFKGNNKYKLLFVLLLSLGSILKIYGFNFIYNAISSVLYPSQIFMKYLYFAFMIFNLIMILRYILFNVSLYLIKNNKLSESTFKPSYLNNYIKDLQELTEDNDILKYFVNYYYRYMLLYIILFIFALIGFIYT